MTPGVEIAKFTHGEGGFFLHTPRVNRDTLATVIRIRAELPRPPVEFHGDTYV